MSSRYSCAEFQVMSAGALDRLEREDFKQFVARRMAILRAEIVAEIAGRGDPHLLFSLGPNTDASSLDGDCCFEQILTDRQTIDDRPRIITRPVIRCDRSFVEEIEVIEFCLSRGDVQCAAD